MPKLVIESKIHGTHTLFYDECDKWIVENNTWSVAKDACTYYAVTTIPHPEGGWYEWRNPKTGKVDRRRRKTKLRLHRAILNPPKKMVVDHINGNGLDNRRENLRVCTVAENTKNQRLPANNKSGYKGVHKNYKGDKRWSVNIMYKGKTRYVGRFDTPEEGARAYDAKAKELYGKFARLNFPEE